MTSAHVTSTRAAQILIVDDEEVLVESLVQSLNKVDGWQARGVHSAEEALEIAQHHELEVVISDIRMPGQGGLELLSRLKADRPEVQVIIMTAYGTRRLQRQALGLGAFHYLEKPVRTRELIEQVRRCLQLNANQRKGGVRGALYRLQVRDIIQLYCTANETVEILIRAPGQPEGRIFLESGQIVHVTDGQKSGEEALHKLLECRSGDITTRPLLHTPKRTIERDWMHLLLEHARRQDEDRHAPRRPDESVREGEDHGCTYEPDGYDEYGTHGAHDSRGPGVADSDDYEELESYEVSAGDSSDSFPRLGPAADDGENPFAALDDWDERPVSELTDGERFQEVADLIEAAITGLLEGRTDESIETLELARQRCLE